MYTYLTELLSWCSGYLSTAVLKSSLKLSILSLNRKFNDVFLSTTSFLMAFVSFMPLKRPLYILPGMVPDLTLTSAGHAQETVWFSPLSAPRTVQGDGSFIHDEFVSFPAAQEIIFRPVPPRHYSKNVLGS